MGLDLTLDLESGFAVSLLPAVGDAVWKIAWLVGMGGAGGVLTVSGYACNNCADCSR